jgi:hypothetical protein
MLEHLDTLIAFVVVMAVVSLMITIITQMVSALLALRGTNLKWGIEELLKTVHPEVGVQAEALARRVLSHPLISDSALADSWIGSKIPAVGGRWRLATAIRVEELVRVLGAVTNDTKETNELREAANQILSKIDPDAPGRISAIAVEIQKLAPHETEKAGQLIRQVTETAQRARGNLEAWFHSAMDRTSQRFVLRMRLWTVVFSVVVAFAIQLDSVSLLTQLYSDVELRARLVAGADAITNQANQILGNTGSAVPSAYVNAVTQLKETLPEAEGLSDPPAFASREDAETWLRAQFGGGQRTERIIGEYRELVQAQLRSAIDRLKDQASSLRAEAGRSGIWLIPDPYPGLRAFLWSMCPVNKQFWGILVSAGLLGLGAPFWFNGLKTLATLRPILATKEQGERQTRA